MAVSRHSPTSPLLDPQIGMASDSISDLATRISCLSSGRREEPQPQPQVDWKEILDFAEETIMRWDLEGACQTFLWQNLPDEVHGYLEAVDNIHCFVNRQLHSKPGCRHAWANKGDQATLDRAQTVLQFAMTRMEEEFRHLLEGNSESVDPNWLFDPDAGPSSDAFNCSFRDLGSQCSSGEGEGEDEDEPESELPSKENVEEAAASRPLQDFNFTIPMLPPELVPDLFGIANRMVTCGYDTECCQVYIGIRKSVVQESLYRLGLQNLSIEDVQRMPWQALAEEMGKWKEIMRPAVRVIFGSEKQLCNQIFAGMDLLQDSTFAEVSKVGITQLLSFSEAIAISHRGPEKLFKILDMYEILRQLLPDINFIFSGLACVGVRSEAANVLVLLGEAAKGTIAAFKSAVHRDVSTIPIFGGNVHPLTRYVMNYLGLLVVYMDTLNCLFADGTCREEPLSPVGIDPRSPAQNISSPLSVQVITLMELLEQNLEEKSKLYKDPSLPYIFLMNNIHYIVQKVRDCEVRTLLGDDWIRKHSRKVHNYHSSYQRAAWTKVLHCLRDEGIRVSGGFSSGVSKTVLRDRFKSFNASFEEVHKIQSSWVVPEYQLSAELRISIGDLLLPAYRSFVGRFHTFLESDKHSEKYLKYTPDDLEACLSDLFAGSAGSSSGSHRRRSSSTAAQ